MREDNSEILETVERILSDQCPLAGSHSPGDWAQQLWSTFEDAGLPTAWAPESAGGAGLSLGTGFGITRLAGKYAVPLPLVDTLLGVWLLSRAGMARPEGSICVAPQHPKDKITLDSSGRLFGKARAIAYAPAVGHFAVLASRGTDPVVALVDASTCSIDPSQTLAGEPSGNVVFDGSTVVGHARCALKPDALLFMGATSRAAMMAGALEASLDLSVDYAKNRVAFGKPIAKFQAVQHKLASLACEAAAAAASYQSAADTLETLGFDGSDGVLLEVAAAKIRCGEAAGAGAALAHQVHGAIGFTKEYPLNLLTRRLWSWRDEFGTESHWALRLGETVVSNGTDELWSLVASR